MEHGLKVILARFGLRQSELAALLDVSPRTVSLWAGGDAALPGPVEGYVRLLGALPEDKRSEEFARLPGRERAFADGLYRFAYSADLRGEADSSVAMCVLRNGQIFGSDAWGGIFKGDYTFSPSSGKTSVRMVLHVPPDGMTITGVSAGREGATFEMKGSFTRPAPTSHAKVKLAGVGVDVVLAYLGPLPE